MGEDAGGARPRARMAGLGRVYVELRVRGRLASGEGGIGHGLAVKRCSVGGLCSHGRHVEGSTFDLAGR